MNQGSSSDSGIANINNRDCFENKLKNSRPSYNGPKLNMNFDNSKLKIASSGTNNSEENLMEKITPPELQPVKDFLESILSIHTG